MKTYEIGISSISPNENDDNVSWTGQCVEAESESEAEDIAISSGRGFYRNVRAREVESSKGLDLIN